MYQIETDKARNLLVITYQGHVTPAELAQDRAKLVAAVGSLQPGFRLLTDLSGLDAMDYACATQIEATMDLMRKKGVAEVVRVVPDPHKDIGFTVMSFFHYRRTVPVLTCETRAEAWQKLTATDRP